MTHLKFPSGEEMHLDMAANQPRDNLGQFASTGGGGASLSEVRHNTIASIDSQLSSVITKKYGSAEQPHYELKVPGHIGTTLSVYRLGDDTTLIKLSSKKEIKSESLADKTVNYQTTSARVVTTKSANLQLEVANQAQVPTAIAKIKKKLEI